MSTIRCVYHEEPKFPASDQHPDAVRYLVGLFYVDAIGGEPTLAAVEETLGLRGNAPILRQLEALDAASKTTRGGRETALILSSLVEHLRTSPTVDPLLEAALASHVDRLRMMRSTEDNAGIVKVKQIEAQADLLRAKLV